MCGILAYYNKSGIDRETISNNLKSLKRIKHRGPDDEGVVLLNSKTGFFKTLKTNETHRDIACNYNSLFEVEENTFDILLGHRRLSIFDTSSAGHQPMHGRTGNWIVFNGEIYNFFEIKEELKTKNYKFITGTDTEVILASYLEWGKHCLNRFNGVWSFVIWDNLKKELFVSNDRFGVKPLYYFQSNTELILTSEIKQMIPFDKLKKELINRKVVDAFLETNYYESNDETLFKSVLRFKPGHYSNINLDFLRKIIAKKYYFFFESSKIQISKKDKIEYFRYLFKDAIKIRMRSDVNWGVTISGGLDSSAIIYFVNQIIKKPINTYSAIFPGKEGDESHHIKRVVEDLGLNASFVNPLEKFSMSSLENHIYHQDFPISSTSSYAEWCVANLAHNKGIKIILNGQGADEVFAGYHHHFYRYCRQLIISGKIRRYLHEINQYSNIKSLNVNNLHKLILKDLKLVVKFKFGLVKISSTLAYNWNQANTLIKLLEIDFFCSINPINLRSDDRNSMAFSVESRHPFMDFRLVEFGFN